MSKRLQVLLDEVEFHALREAAARDGVTVADWVRGALREARRREPQGDLEGKLRAVRAATRHELPTADIDEMLAEIERGDAALDRGHRRDAGRDRARRRGAHRRVIFVDSKMLPAVERVR